MYHCILKIDIKWLHCYETVCKGHFRVTIYVGYYRITGSPKPKEITFFFLFIFIIIPHSYIIKNYSWWCTIMKKRGINSVFWVMMGIWDANMTVLFSSCVWDTNTLSIILRPNGFFFAVSPHYSHVWWITIFTLILWTAASLQTHTRQADRDVIYFRKPKFKIMRKMNHVTDY